MFRCIEEACAEESARWGKDTITYTVETYFDVRAGALDDHAPLVEAAWSAAVSLGNQPFLVEGGPTNASIPIGMGIPAVCIGDDEVNVYAHNAAKERFPVKHLADAADDAAGGAFCRRGGGRPGQRAAITAVRRKTNKAAVLRRGA